MEACANGIRERVLAFIAGQGAAGATTDEVEAALDGRHQTISARVNELARAGRIQAAECGTRKTRSGRSAQVWVACAGKPPEAPRPAAVRQLSLPGMK